MSDIYKTALRNVVDAFSQPHIEGCSKDAPCVGCHARRAALTIASELLDDVLHMSVDVPVVASQLDRIEQKVDEVLKAVTYTLPIYADNIPIEDSGFDEWEDDELIVGGHGMPPVIPF